MAIVYPNQNSGEDDFTIGDVTLSIPPESISTFRVENNDEINSLRAKFPMFTKSGQSLFNATVTWKAVLGTTVHGTPDYSQWEDVRRIVAMFKSAPFVQVENPHLRGVLQMESSARMVFGLRQLNISTVPDSTEVLQMSLDLTFFNYLPYSKSFAYLSNDGKEVDSDADDTMFGDYIDEWIDSNLDQNNGVTNTSGWRTNNTGDIKFSYRTYQAFTNYSNPTNPDKGLLFATYPGKDTQHQWRFDYATEKNSFYYYDNEVNYTSGEFDSTTIVAGISVNFRNNFAQIPLAAYQYPTYQHLGPAVTSINIALQSNDIDGDDLGLIQNGINVLNTQYFSMKPLWLSTSSLHRMQALYVDNQLLNMLGISSLITSSFTTTTDQESLSITGQLVASQYENVFEVLQPFRIKDPTAAHLAAIQQISEPSNLDGLSQDAQNAIAPLTEYWAKQKTGDMNYLYSKLGIAPSNPQDKASFKQALGQLPQQPFSMAGADTSIFKQIGAYTWPDFGIPVAQVVPGMQARLNVGAPTYADLVILTGWFQNNNPTAPVFMGDDTEFSGDENLVTLDITLWTNNLVTYGNQYTPTLQTALYQALFQLLYIGSSQFSQAVEEVANTPQYKSSIAASQQVQANGPGSDTDNSAHVAYADLGLKRISYGSYDYTPTFYLANDSTKTFNSIKDEMTSTLDSAKTTAGSQFNVSNGKTYVYTTDHLIMPDSLTGGKYSDLFTRMNVNLQNPVQAFPTFKLFLLEDKSGQITYAYDDFYSYSSVQSIEVIKYQDKPDAAMISVSNVAGLLSHRLYDNSADGFREWQKDNTAQASTNVIASSTPGETGGTVAGPAGSVDKDLTSYRNGLYYQDGNTVTAAPLKYYPLQTGSKIQVRMGYSNNPDKLFPVFSGIITEIEEESELITIMAQSFMIELTDCPDDFISTDHWNLLSYLTAAPTLLAESGAEIRAGNLIGAIGKDFQALKPNNKAPAFGQAILGDDGTSLGVISKMLQSPSAKHFGRWQINSPSGRDPFVRGYQWQVNPSANGQTILNALSSLYDRSAENVMTGTRINSTGAKENEVGSQLGRDWNYENTLGGATQYHIPAGKSFSPWEIIKDISRRYPENILAVKNYGFPWNCDATLVFGNPYDFYRARATSISELGGSSANNTTDTALFQEWWQSGGKAEFQLFGQRLAAVKDAYATGVDTGLQPVENTLEAVLITGSHGSEIKIIEKDYSYEEFTRYLTAWATVLSGFDGVVHRIVGNTVDFFNPFEHQSYAERLKTVRDTLKNLQAQSSAYIQKSKSGTYTQSPSDLVQPVRKIHFADHNSIIHNGIRLNGNIYNSVRIGEEVLCASESIPSHHRRVLDCNDLIVSRENLDGAINDVTRKAYGQSFLTEEMGKMYQGELLLRGDENLEPFDIILIHDPITGIKGPIRIKKVIHSYDLQNGFISIVTPECLILTNEMATASALGVLDYAITTTVIGRAGLLDSYMDFAKNHATAIGLTGVGAAAVLPTAIAGVELAATIIGGTVLLPVAIVGLLLLSAYGLHKFTEASRTLTLIIPMVLSRYGKVWAAGIEGYRSENFFELFKDRYEGFLAEEFYPLLESWRTLRGDVQGSIGSSGTNVITTQPSVITPNSKKVGTMPPATEAALKKYSAEHSFPLSVARGIAWIESRGNQFNPKTGAVNKNPGSSAKGVMQLTDPTAKSLGVDSSQLESNVEGGVRYLANLLKTFNNDQNLAIAAFYDGPGNIKKNGISDNATKQYVANVLYAIS